MYKKNYSYQWLQLKNVKNVVCLNVKKMFVVWNKIIRTHQPSRDLQIPILSRSSFIFGIFQSKTQVLINWFCHKRRSLWKCFLISNRFICLPISIELLNWLVRSFNQSMRYACARVIWINFQVSNPVAMNR